MVAGAVPPLIALLESEQPSVQEEAAVTLWTLADDCLHNQAGSRSYASAQCLVEVKAVKYASHSSRRFVKSSNRHQDAIMAAGAVLLLSAF